MSAVQEKMAKLNEMLNKDKAIIQEKIFLSLFDIVFIVDTNYNIIQVSPSVRALGYNPEDIELGSIYSIANDNSSLAKVFNQLSNGVKHVVEVPLMNKGKAIIWFEVFATKIKIEEEELFIVIASDITDRKYAEQQLRQHSETIEAQLKQEKEYRVQENKSNFQRKLSFWLIILIAGIMIIPLIFSGFINMNETYLNSIQQSALLLINGLLLIVNSIFATDDKKRD